ncbi:DUF4148 domain-containing protein [Ramlibacter sp.]|uniref:DUF4148 domain-containing protein n=1 Tax=Ramlibacter sp. TaxID=1917967 RepID=UPI002FC8D296
MNKSLIAVLLLASTAAFANEAADELANRTPFDGERARADVQAEIVDARATGTLNVDLYVANRNSQPVQSRRSRSDVRAEAVKASHNHVVQEFI